MLSGGNGEGDNYITPSDSGVTAKPGFGGGTGSGPPPTRETPSWASAVEIDVTPDKAETSSRFRQNLARFMFMVVSLGTAGRGEITARPSWGDVMTFPISTVTQTFRLMPVVELSRTEAKCETFPIWLTFPMAVLPKDCSQLLERQLV